MLPQCSNDQAAVAFLLEPFTKRFFHLNSRSIIGYFAERPFRFNTILADQPGLFFGVFQDTNVCHRVIRSSSLANWDLPMYSPSYDAAKSNPSQHSARQMAIRQPASHNEPKERSLWHLCRKKYDKGVGLCRGITKKPPDCFHNEARTPEAKR